jgi:hypothetical protein
LKCESVSSLSLLFSRPGNHYKSWIAKLVDTSGQYSQSPASATEGTSVITLDNIGFANVGVVIYFLNGESPTLEIIARDDTIVEH